MNQIFSKYLVYYPLYSITGKGFHRALRGFENSQWYSPETLKIQQFKILKNKLIKAYHLIPYYKKMFDMQNLSPRTINSMSDMIGVPILTKKNIKDNFKDLLDHRRNWPRYLRETSGSTGTPLSLYKDGENIAIMDAIMHRNYNWYDIRIGDRQARYWGSPLSGAGKTKIALKDFLLNRVRFSPFYLTDDAYGKHLGTLFRFKPSFVYGYAQTIFSFSEYILKNGLDLSPLNLKAVIITGEMATRDQISSIRCAFKSPVSNEYGCTEAGVIAMECPQGKMHLMVENLFIEFVKDGRHVQAGEEGEIIITELYGSVMPLIRYQVGDVGSFSEETCNCGRGLLLLNNLKGRNDEFIVCSDGKRVDPIIFEYILKEIGPSLGKITRFRITQTKINMLEIETCYEGKVYDKITRIISIRLNKAIGGKFALVFKPKDSIPVEPTGKLRCFISKLKD